jgi:2-keto-3-deoxy-galactonokinase
MFRNTLIRSAIAASRITARPAARVVVSRNVAAAAARPAMRVSSLFAVRSYSAAAGLKKEEVEGRIMGILQGFDKVNDATNVRCWVLFTVRWVGRPGTCNCRKLRQLCNVRCSTALTNSGSGGTAKQQCWILG